MSLIRIALIFVFLTFLSNPLTAQSDYTAWDAATVSKAREFAKHPAMNEVEEEIAFLLNLLRADQLAFYNALVIPYLKQHNERQDRYVKTLERRLKKSVSLPLLMSNRDLYKIAKNHAYRMGKRGKVGHQGYQQRIRGAFAQFSNMGENCDYGNQQPLDILMSLLIDRGVADLGHRKSLLDPDFQFVGISLQPHRKYRHNCVIELAGK